MTLTEPSTKKREHRDLQGKIGIPLCYLFLILFVLFTVVPIIWLGLLTVKPLEEFHSLKIFPEALTSEHYGKLLFGTLFPRWMFNSIIVSSGYATVSVLVAAMAGYAFAFYKFRGKETLFLLILSAMVIPPFTLVIPWYVMFRQFLNFPPLIGINTYLAVILPGTASAFGLFFMRVYIKSAVHPEILEAARVDGASEHSIFFKMVVPIIFPGIATMFILAFTIAFNNFFWPLIALSGDMATLPVGMAAWAQLVVGAAPRWGILVAGSLISMIPMLIVFIFFQKKYITGLTFGIPKG